jgi:enoyl-CoA hydratase
MEYQNIILEKDEKDRRITNLILNRPESLNALSGALLDEIAAAIEEVDADDEAVVLIFKGAGRAFSTGYDIGGGVRRAQGDGEAGRPREYTQPTIGPARAGMIRSVERYFRLWNLRKPTIAQVHGYCLSGGTELVAMCDIVIAAEDAQFGHIAGRHMGTLRTNSLWPYTIGMRKTKELLFTGDFIDGKTAEKWGMINKAVPIDELEEEVYDMARRILRIPPEVLWVHKGTTNQFYENMGIHASLMSAAFYDSVSGFLGGSPDFAKNAREKGMREALRLRDAPWREYKRVTLPKKQDEE